MRIIAGAWRGRRLHAPPGTITRPTAERLRQALFDMLAHAPWAGRGAYAGGLVLDLFAGTGALGLEALSRGAATAEFYETDAAARIALRRNLDACGTAAPIHGDACRPLPGPPAALVLLDPPYGRALVPAALAALRAARRIAPATLLVAELAAAEASPHPHPLADRAHGMGRVVVWREPAG